MIRGMLPIVKDETLEGCQFETKPLKSRKIELTTSVAPASSAFWRSSRKIVCPPGY